MTITFYYIPAISVNSEPFFADASSRTSILHSKIVKVWDTSYVPPLYTNKIKITTDILPFNLRANYVKIPKFGFDWYYFIDSFTYINETTYFINLSIDAIQTFYFATSFKRFEEKRSLSYKGLRDNISLDPTLYPDTITNYDYGKPYIIVVQYNTRLDTQTFGQCFNVIDDVTVSHNSADWDFKVNQIHKPNDVVYTDGLKTLFLPLTLNSIEYCKFINPNGAEKLIMFDREKLMDTINKLANDPNLVNMYVTRILPPDIYYGDFTYNNTNYTGWVLNINCQLFSNYLIKTGNSYLMANTEINLYVVKQNYGSFTTPVRALCDTNYTQICIGEVNDYVPVPIELLEPSTTYNVYCILDVCSGVRTYGVEATSLERIKFRHVCNSVENLQTFNENYNMYLLQNKGALTTGVALQKTMAWTNFANQIFNQNAAKAFSGAMQGGVAGGIVAGAEATVTSGVDMFNTMYSIDKSIQTQRENAYYTPDTIKQGNNYTNDVANGFLDRIIMITKVADYQDIIELRKYIGYLSHDIYSHRAMLTLLNSIPEVNGKRLLMGSCELYIPFFGTRDNIVAIKDRLEKGVRFYTDINKLGE